MVANVFRREVFKELLRAEKGNWGISGALRHCKFYYVQVHSVDIKHLHFTFYCIIQANSVDTELLLLGIKLC